MATLARTLVHQAGVFVAEFFNILHYFSTARKVLARRHQWTVTGRCPLSIWLVFSVVFTILSRLCMFPIFYFVPSIDKHTQVLWGNVLHFFGLDGPFNVVVFVIASPISLYYLLLYPYITRKSYEPILLPAARIGRQLSLPAKQREVGFQKTYQTLRLLIFLFLSVTIMFLIVLVAMSTNYVLAHAHYFFASWCGLGCLLFFELNMCHICFCFLAMARTFFDIFLAMFFSSVYAFRDLERAMRLIRRPKLHWQDLRQFRREHTAVVTRVFGLNNIIGNILLLYYIANCPTNANLLVHVCMHREASMLIKVFLCAFMSHQLTYIVGIHLLAASYRRNDRYRK